MKIYHRCRRRIEQINISIDTRIKYFGVNSLWALILRNHLIFLVIFSLIKILLFILMIIAVATFPSVLASSSSNIQSSSNSPGSRTSRVGINHLEEPEDEPIELFVSLRQLQSYHHQPQPHSYPSTHQSSIRMAWNEEDGDVQMDEPNNGPMFESDDLIYSGSGCFDDEDKCSGFAEPDPSDDDLITPVYTPPKTSSPVTMTPNTTNTNTTDEPDEDDDGETDDGGGVGDDEDEGGSDDEDDDEECTTDEENCVEGSGSEEPTSTQLPSNAFSTQISTNQLSTDLNQVTKSSSHHQHSTQPPAHHKPPSFSIPSPVWPMTTQSSIDQPFLPSDPTIYEDLRTPPPWQERPRPRPTQPWSTSPKPPVTRPTHTHPINLPRPPRVEPEEPVEKPKNLLIPTPANNSDTDSMATVIGFVGIVLISTVITIPLFLFLRVRNRSRQRYKQATGRQGPKTLGFLPVSGTPPLLSSASHQTQLNSALITGTNGKSSKSSKKKDSREWYV